MHVLTLMPQLLDFSFFGPLIIRVVAGALLVYLGKMRYQKSSKWLAVFWIVPGLMIFIGLYTQAAALLGILVMIADWKITQESGKTALEADFVRVLISAILLSLMFTGPGALAIDLPL